MSRQHPTELPVREGRCARVIGHLAGPAAPLLVVVLHDRAEIAPPVRVPVRDDVPTTYPEEWFLRAGSNEWLPQTGRNAIYLWPQAGRDGIREIGSKNAVGIAVLRGGTAV